jgi:DNA modification methylase
MAVTILHGDCRAVLPTLAGCSVQCCVTSPPYYGLRDYGVDGQIGLEPTPDSYVAEMVAVFREVRRVLRDDGTLWLNIGDSYSGSGPSGASYQSKTTLARAGKTKDGNFSLSQRLGPRGMTYADKKPVPAAGTKSKDLLGIPWLLAFALRADGWFLRSDIIWHKPNPMPESVRDRPTSAHEHVFLLSKRGTYFYDADAVREPHTRDWWNETPSRPGNPDRKDGGGRQGATETAGANARNVWTIATQPFSGAHFATMPPDLAERCIKAGTKPGDMVLDPFGGAGTTGLVADRLGRNATLIELNPAYRTLAADRITADAPLFAGVA